MQKIHLRLELRSGPHWGSSSKPLDGWGGDTPNFWLRHCLRARCVVTSDVARLAWLEYKPEVGLKSMF